MKYAAIALLSAVLFFFCDSCQKTVTLDLNTAPAQIVIQGEVTNAAGPYTVTINQTTGFYEDNIFPAISGASVKISDGQGVTDSLTETSPGTYTTHVLQGQPGNTYTLTVFALQTTYTAVSTMPQPVPLDSVTFQNSTRLRKTTITALANFQDPGGVKNYYQFIQYINGVQFTKSIYVFDDRLSDGRYISYNLRMDSTYLSIGDQVKVVMNCIDENVYNYFYQLNQSSSTGVFNTTAAPANPSTNISNGSYGYFSAHTTNSRTATVE